MKHIYLKNRRIYVAGAIRDNGRDESNIDKNIELARTFYEELIKLGYSPIVQHLQYWAQIKSEKTISWERCLQIDFDMLATCGALIRLENKSEGADAEVRYAKFLEIPVFYMKSSDEIKKHLGFADLQNIKKYIKT